MRHAIGCTKRKFYLHDLANNLYGGENNDDVYEGPELLGYFKERVT